MKTMVLRRGERVLAQRLALRSRQHLNKYMTSMMIRERTGELSQTVSWIAQAHP
jgi:hypothetical protein